ncbi:hypothetical protein [Streptomyces sp. SHP 1-2]|uniref:hypothetical protein n=1 Tax=Streptomyces sp. SHP 1-2 TaxID=2769489 RepID=UPI0022389DAC|nr:hypothetical protein [Streptomyces sp. SHP 1-2]MCW5250741.1 hypothetical protein [Streptomyces sp. SHP 1-2]
MIAKISSGKSTAGLSRYLYGPGRANEHTDPDLVASRDGYAPDPGCLRRNVTRGVSST